MPEFTTHATWTCSTNVSWFINVPSSTGGMHTVTWGRLYGRDAEAQGCQFGFTCSCDGFTYRRTCRHVKAEEARDRRCGWNAELEITLEADTSPTGDPCCPECGGPVEAFNVAV